MRLTLNTYAHVIEASRDQAANVMERVLTGRPIRAVGAGLGAGPRLTTGILLTRSPAKVSYPPCLGGSR